MKRVYSPTSEAELVFVQSLLLARDIPFLIDQGGFGGVYPGLYIDHYTRKWVLVDDRDYAQARELIVDALPATVALTRDRGPDRLSWMQKLRMVCEAFLFGWFVPSPTQSRTEGGDSSDES